MKGSHAIGGPERDQENAVIHTPQHERPGRAVPESPEHHGNEEVAVDPGGRAAAATQRNIEVVAQPC